MSDNLTLLRFSRIEEKNLVFFEFIFFSFFASRQTLKQFATFLICLLLNVVLYYSVTFVALFGKDQKILLDFIASPFSISYFGFFRNYHWIHHWIDHYQWFQRIISVQHFVQFFCQHIFSNFFFFF